MLKFLIFGVAIGVVSAQNFKQVQTFPAQLAQVQPEIHIQPQVCKLKTLELHQQSFSFYLKTNNSVAMNSIKY